MLIKDALEDTELMSDSEKELASFFLQERLDVVALTARQLAASLFVSPSTVTRFCQRLVRGGLARRSGAQEHGAGVERRNGEAGGDGGYEFHVRDNGIGMSREFQEHLFESFTREETSTVSGIQGTGLGMAINVSHMVQEIAMELLSNAGFSVSLADDGDVAVETLRTAAPDQFDLVLMDIQMPKLDGYSATRQIRTLDSAIAKVLG